MQRKERNLQTYLTGLAIFILFPILVIMGLALYVHIANSAPQTGALQTSLSREVTFTGWESVFYINYSGQPETKPTPPRPIDMAFLIDVSGSMTESLPSMSTAARQAAADLSKSNPRLINFALIQFDSDAKTLTGWTPEPDKLYEGLQKLSVMTGQNDSRAAFNEIDKLFAVGRQNARKVIVFYTDGELVACGDGCTPMSWDEMESAAKRLRDQGAEIYSVGLPGTDSNAEMLRIAGSSSNIFDPVDMKDLLANFRRAARQIIPSENVGQLTHQLDGRYFSAPLGSTGWTVNPNGILNLTIGKVPKNPSTYAHPVIPLSWGVWRVGSTPPKFVYLSEDGQPQQAVAERQPLMLVIGWFPLLFSLLPALLWTIYYYRPINTKPVESEISLPEFHNPPPPGLLPALPTALFEEVPPVPTLFIGLGGAGLRALHAVRGDLKQSHSSNAEQPYRFLWIDVDAKESLEDLPFVDWHEYPIEEAKLPPEIYRLELPDPRNVPSFLKWFDVRRYERNVSRDGLNLADGSRGDRMLARLALFKWLEQAEPLTTFKSKIAELGDFAAVNGTRQIIVFASSDGGVGSGWFFDIGRLLRRITSARRQQSSDNLVPDIIGIWCPSPENPKPDNQQALLLEAQTAGLTGAYPQQIQYTAENDDILQATDTKSPYDWIFDVKGYDKNSIAAQGAELGAVLVEKAPRRTLLEQAARHDAEVFFPVKTRGLHILATDLREKVFYNLFLRTIGPDVLLDVKQDENGGFISFRINPNDAQKKLSEWSGTLPGENPFQLLIAAAVNPAQTNLLLNSLRTSSSLTSEWMINALISFVNQRLRGQKEENTGLWRRGWMPGEAIGVLDLLASQIENLVIPQMQSIGAELRDIELLNSVKIMAASGAKELAKWIDEFCRISHGMGDRYNNLDRVKVRLRTLEDRTYLDLSSESQTIETITRDLFTGWLGTMDISSSIRERLYFVFEPESDKVKITLNSSINRQLSFDSAESANSELVSFFKSLSLLAPAARISGGILTVTDEMRKTMAENLVVNTPLASKTLLIAPATNRFDQNEISTFEKFIKMIPQPANQGNRFEVRGNDQSAVRRLELLSSFIEPGDGGNLPFIIESEQLAERVRLFAEQKYLKRVPLFPTELRIAFSQEKEFLIFARAYKNGQIILRRDSTGINQWIFSETSEVLTFGQNPTLAQAAANFVYYARDKALSVNGNETSGDFTRLRAWLEGIEQITDDILTLLAIDVADDCLGTH